MKPNWLAAILGAVIVAASFAVAFNEGVNSVAHDQSRLALTQAG